MNLRLNLIGAGVLLLFASGVSLAASPLPEKGPCDPATTTWSTPGNCEPACRVACWDPVSYVTLTSGECLGYSMSFCTTTLVSAPDAVKRDCECPFLGGACVDEGEYNSGIQFGWSCQGEISYDA